MHFGDGESLPVKPVNYAFFVRKQYAVSDVGVISIVIVVNYSEDCICDVFELGFSCVSESLFLGNADILANGIARYGRRFCYRPEAVPRLVPSQNIQNLNHGVLLFRHATSLSRFYKAVVWLFCQCCYTGITPYFPGWV